ncbi:MAG: hypothetical protein GXP24_09655 [Planctomycetes bacterium]|nr:hypothetical protein [Planctomycetota bacterium]
MNWNQIFHRLQQRGQNWLQQTASDLQLLVDTSQLNRRTRTAWRQGRTIRASYLLADHQRRRITRRREIRRLVEGRTSCRGIGF